MVNKITLCMFILIAHCSLFIAPTLFASGSTDTEEVQTINNDWVLCVTAFDFSRLPAARRITADVITRELVDRLKTISYRVRISPEFAYYENHAWHQSIRTITRSIAQRQDERSLLLFRGESDRRYQANLKRVDTELEKLMENLANAEEARPTANREPAFTLTQGNLSGTFPQPPRAGTEYRFSQSQRADAFLVGEIREFHGRYYIQLRLYTLFTNSFVYEDDILFSLDDMMGAVDEIAARLIGVISGSRPAAVAVYADPPEAQVLINQNFD